jgi:uncharacterized protein (DUF983 family)
MLKKGTKLNSILTGSCPRCQNESMYIDKNPYHLYSLFKMHENCNHCGLHYKIEPSFFYGAMYVSYALAVALGVATFIISNVFLNFDLLQSFIAIFIVLILLTPVTARLARNIYINMFVQYNKEAKVK